MLFRSVSQSRYTREKVQKIADDTENVAMLPEGMINYIYDAITAHEEKVQKIADDTEKN